MPAQTPWYAGVQVPLSFTLTDTTGNPVNASGGTGTVVATVTLPDGTTATPAVTAPGNPGVYNALYTTSQAGHHIVTWTVPGTNPGSFTDTFEVQPATDGTIVSLAEAKEILKATSAQFDQVIQGYNAAITDWVEYVCGPVVSKTIVEVLPADGVIQVLSKPPVIQLLPWTQPPSFLANSGIPVPSPASPMYPMRIYGITYPATALSLDPARGLVSHQSGLPFIFGSYVWQYQAGRQVIPNGIYEACKIALKHVYAVERGGQPGGSQAAYGTSVASGVQTGFGFSVPNRAIQLLEPFSGIQRAAIA